MTTNIALNTPAYNSTAWDVPLNYNAAILDSVFGATTSVPVNTGAVPTYTLISAPNSSLTGSTSQCMRFNLTGALAANQLVLLPQGIAGMWIATNSTTNAFTITLGSNNGSNSYAGATVSLAQGYSTIVYCDGTNVYLANDGQTAGSGVTSFQTSLSGLTPSSSASGAVTLAGTLGPSSGGTGLTNPGAIGNVLTSDGAGGWLTQAPTAASYTAGSGITISGSNVISMSGNYSSSLSVAGLTSSSGVTASAGNITASTGNITASSGSISGVGITSSNGLTVSSGNISVSSGSITASTNITASSGNISASSGSITASTNITATSGDITASAGKVVAGNTTHYLQSSGTSRIWQVSSTTSIYWDTSASIYYFNPSGVNGCLTLSSSQFKSAVTPYANQTAWTLISDRSVKKDISPVSGASQRILGLKPVNFTWIKTGKNDSGFIAQDFEEVYPQNIQTDEEGKKAIALNMNVYADLVSTIQELHKKIESLEARLAAANP